MRNHEFRGLGKVDQFDEAMTFPLRIRSLKVESIFGNTEGSFPDALEMGKSGILETVIVDL